MRQHLQSGGTVHDHLSRHPQRPAHRRQIKSSSVICLFLSNNDFQWLILKQNERDLLALCSPSAAITCIIDNISIFLNQSYFGLRCYVL